MFAFYMDERLSGTEELEVLEQLADFGESIADGIEYRRIPFVFPIGLGSATDGERVNGLKSHLRNAGVPAGRQSLFILPRDGIRWAIILQQPFREISGNLPYAVQPWQRGDDGALVRRDHLFVIDMSGAPATGFAADGLPE